MEDTPSGVFAPRVVLPGDKLDQEVTAHDSEQKVLLGPGLRRQGAAQVIVTKAGVLRKKAVEENSVVLWVDCHSRRYVAARGENVVGVVTSKAGDFFRVDIGVAETASLSYLAFESATKKNRYS